MLPPGYLLEHLEQSMTGGALNLVSRFESKIDLNSLIVGLCSSRNDHKGM